MKKFQELKFDKTKALQELLDLEKLLNLKTNLSEYYDIMPLFKSKHYLSMTLINSRKIKCVTFDQLLEGLKFKNLLIPHL